MRMLLKELFLFLPFRTSMSSLLKSVKLSSPLPKD